MTKMYIFLIIVIIVIVGIYFLFGAKKTEQNVKVHTTEENAYEGLRKMCFETTPKQLGFEADEKELKTYGVVMDMGLDGTTITLVTYETGDASIYLSTGGGVIGGGQHETVNKAAKQFLKFAQSQVSKASKAENQDLPKGEDLYFYFLTNKGVLLIKDNMIEIESKKSINTELFEEANKVFTELRLTTEK